MLVRVRTRRESRRSGREARRAEREARRQARGADREAPEARGRPTSVLGPSVDIAPDDPVLAYFQSVTGPVDIEKLDLASPGLAALKQAGVKLAVPLVSQGELIGLLNLGPRLSEQEYSTDDRKLLENLAAQAAPAVRVAQLVREQQAEAAERQRIEQELEVARLIQQNFLPKELPRMPGWDVGAYYRPARVVGGDFYDFIELPEGKIGLVVGDVTDKGVPAAMVMAATRSVLRAAAERLVSPGEVLARVNELLVSDMPPNMFVTCLYGALDPATGAFRFANAGHNLPYVRTEGGVVELKATGTPLGLFPGVTYEETEASLAAGETVLLHSDGLAEAHDAEGEMFGFPRVKQVMHGQAGGSNLIGRLLSELDSFTGEGWEQEDDVTLVVLRRTGKAAVRALVAAHGERTIAEFSLPSEPGNERIAMERVADVAGEHLPAARLERLKTAVAEATMNAMEHGNRYRPDADVDIRVAVSRTALSVYVTDHGGGRSIPEPETPDLDAKVAGEQAPRGWGLFLIKNMVDDLRVTSDDTHHTLQLVFELKGDDDEDG